MSSACSCCSGTDTAKECAQGQCYAEQQQRQSMEAAADEAAMQEAWDEDMQARYERSQQCDQRLMVDP